MRAKTLLSLAGSAVALLVSSAGAAADGRVVPLSFSGASCSAIASTTYQLPSAARLAYARTPTVGDWVGATKADSYSRQAMARVTGVDLRGRALTVTLAADPARCLGSGVPGEPVDAPWTAALDADLSWIVPDERWARLQTKSLIAGGMAQAFADDATIRCRRAGEARFRCSFGTWAGDASASGRGTLSLGRDDEFAHYSFRVRTFDEYCYYVVHRPLRRCVKTDRWKG